jgi:arginyl-tRNA synthetase
MPTIIEQLEPAFRAAITAALGLDADPALSVSQNEKFGDYQANAAMSLAKRVTETTGEKTNPRTIAERIKAKLDLGELASEISIAGPGFINVKLSPLVLAKRIQSTITDARLGLDPVAHPITAVIDYSGLNVAKQAHVGHLRSTVIGDALSRVLEFQGHRVIRQNHIGDWGTQFGMLIAHLKNQSPGEQARIEDLDQFYKQARQRFDSDPVFADEARATVVRLQAGGDAEMKLWKQIVDQSRLHFQAIYDQMGIGLTVAEERGESTYNSMLAENVAELKSRGVARESNGATVIFTDGFEAPLMIQKTGGGFGYGITDLSALRYRVQTLGAQRVIYVVGSPQAQHLKQVFDAVKKAGWAGDAVFEHVSFGSILGEDGKMFKARSGDSVKLIDLLNEAEELAFAVVSEKSPDLPEEQRKKIAHAVGIGAIKYGDLSRDRAGDYTFLWSTMLALDGNTGPYLQYAYARIQSIFRRAAERGIAVDRPFVADVKLESPFELALAKHVLRFGEIIDLVSRELKPHHLCTYLYELATRFSGFFENCPVLQSENPLRSSRLALCEATGRTFATGLDLLGIEHPEQM